MTTQLLKSFTISFRKNQFYNIINLLIMSVSMTTILFIGMYVYFELSYDSFHNHQREYRVESHLYQVVGSALPFSWFEVILLASVTVLGTIFVSFYAALTISKISLVKIMRGNFATSRLANRIRRVLVSVQFACSFILICSTATIVCRLNR